MAHEKKTFVMYLLPVVHLLLLCLLAARLHVLPQVQRAVAALVAHHLLLDFLPLELLLLDLWHVPSAASLRPVRGEVGLGQEDRIALRAVALGFARVDSLEVEKVLEVKGN